MFFCEKTCTLRKARAKNEDAVVPCRSIAVKMGKDEMRTPISSIASQVFQERIERELKIILT